MNVQDDTVTITITSRLAKTGKSTIARIIAEALGKVGLSTGVEDTYVRRSEGITKNYAAAGLTVADLTAAQLQDLMDHCDAIGVLADRNQSILIRVLDGSE